jgi:hypothetical protein
MRVTARRACPIVPIRAPLSAGSAAARRSQCSRAVTRRLSQGPAPGELGRGCRMRLRTLRITASKLVANARDHAVTRMARSSTATTRGSGTGFKGPAGPHCGHCGNLQRRRCQADVSSGDSRKARNDDRPHEQACRRLPGTSTWKFSATEADSTASGIRIDMLADVPPFRPRCKPHHTWITTGDS